MDQETTYIRSNTMEQNNSPQESENRSQQGTFEWLKFIVFLGGILLITALVIRVIGPIIFTQYVPPIVGITETTDDNGAMVDDDQDSQEEVPASSEPADNDSGESDGDPEPAAEAPEEPIESESNTGDGSEPDPLQTEEETSSKVEDPVDDSETEPETEPEYMTYIVLPGETLTSIAAAHEMTVDTLIAANELINPNYVTAGQEIRIPK